MISLDLPPGVFRVGTEYQSAGRWFDCNLVRWNGGIMQPVGGWRVRASGAPCVRGGISWLALNGDKQAAFGSCNGLYRLPVNGAPSSIGPVDLAAGRMDQGGLYGYGTGKYGAGKYGTPRAEAGTIAPATTWSLDTWGENLIAVSSADRRILQWQPNPGTAATRVTNSPTCEAALVTDERFIFALGAGGDPRKVAWCDRENNTVWTPSSLNEAGDMTLQTQGRIMAGVRGKGQAVILTDQDAHAATYIAPPYVYRFERVGSSCGLVSPLAVAAVDAGVIWMGESSFYAYSGGAVAAIDCSVADFVFGDINRGQSSKISAVTNQRFGEIWWFYPSSGSIECDRYVVYNYVDGVWYIGALGRTSGIDAGVFRTPIWFGSDGNVYDHEAGFSHGDNVAYAETGPITLGDSVMTATMLIPDERTQGDVRARFSTRLYPNADERWHGPYQMGQPTSVRFTGRQVRMRVEANRPDDWRVGVMRLDVRQRGMR